jgi:alginate O-acetyltransferase complex protein AlgI
MLFNSFEFFVFLPIVFILYWFVFNKQLKWQNAFLLLASYFFYGWWDYRFLFLLMFSTLLDYYTGLKIAEAESTGRKKFWLFLSITINLGFLAVFKYFNFFTDSLGTFVSFFGYKMDTWTLKILLPVGISFYTFHGISYIVDIYKDRIKPQRNFVDYAVFVSFFPLLVAGPIERATHLLPQIKRKREFNYDKAVDGVAQMLWGLFKKVVIADNCAVHVNRIFDNYETLPASTLVIGAVYFAIQIYCDFSGYSDIALGCARLFGMELLRNFAYPYFSRDIAEFWRRWHISLTTWFRDYLYIPLGGSKGGKMKVIRNTFVIFLVSGFWHGANWTFIIWGFLNALYFLPLLLSQKNRRNLDNVATGRLFPNLREIFQMVSTFLLVSLTWVFFRASSVSQAIDYLKHVFSKSLLTTPKDVGVKVLAPVILIMFVAEWLQRDQDHALRLPEFKLPFVRVAIFYAMIFAIIFLGNFGSNSFIYFQF